MTGPAVYTAVNSFFFIGISSEFGMGKKSFAEVRSANTREFFERRRRNPKEDMIFPASASEIRARVLETEAEITRACEEHIQEADAELARRGTYYITFDNESYLLDRRFTQRGDLPANWSWHEQYLMKKGRSNEEMRRRKERQTTLEIRGLG